MRVAWPRVFGTRWVKRGCRRFAPRLFCFFTELDDGAEQVGLVHVLHLVLSEVELPSCQGDSYGLSPHELERVELARHPLFQTGGAGVTARATEDPSEDLRFAGVHV